jgi:hypothetical protein
MFSIGAKLLGSFSGAMRQAMSRLQKLQWTARNAMRAIGLMGAALTGLAIGAGITAAGLILRKIFSGAEAAYKNALEVQTQLGTVIENNNKLHGIGVEASREDVALLSKQAEEMQKVGVNSDEIMLTGAKTLSQFGEAPKKVAAWLPIMDDVLAATKGVNASQGDAQVLAMKIGKAVHDGQLMGLKRLGVEMGNLTPKEFKALSIEERRLRTMTALEAKFKGASAALGATDVGQIRIMNNLFDNLQEKIGKITIGYKVKWAEFLIKLLPKLEPVIERIGAALGKLFGGVEKKGQLVARRGFGKMFVGAEKQTMDFSKAIDTVVKALEKLADAIEWIAKNRDWLLPLAKNVAIVTAALYALSVVIGIVSAVMALTPVGWMIIGVAALAAGIILLIKNWDAVSAAMSRAWEYMKQMPILGPVFQDLERDLKGIYAAWGQIDWSVWAYAWEQLKADWTALVTWLTTPIDFSAIWESLKSTFANALTDLKAQWNAFAASLHLPSFLQFGGVGTAVPTGGAARAAETAQGLAPGMSGQSYQLGGIVNRMTTATLGERGPEAVVPLSGGRRAAGLLDYANRALGMGAAAGPTALSFAPVITINGNATETEQRAMDSRLRDLASDFIAQFKAAQHQERRLSYEGGYG